MRNLDFHSHYAFWGFVGAIWRLRRRNSNGAGIILSDWCSFRACRHRWFTCVGIQGAEGFHVRILPLEMSILLLSLLFIGPGKYSVDKT